MLYFFWSKSIQLLSQCNTSKFHRKVLQFQKDVSIPTFDLISLCTSKWLIFLISIYILLSVLQLDYIFLKLRYIVLTLVSLLNLTGIQQVFTQLLDLKKHLWISPFSYFKFSLWEIHNECVNKVIRRNTNTQGLFNINTKCLSTEVNARITTWVCVLVHIHVVRITSSLSAALQKVLCQEGSCSRVGIH